MNVVELTLLLGGMRLVNVAVTVHPQPHVVADPVVTPVAEDAILEWERRLAAAKASGAWAFRVLNGLHGGKPVPKATDARNVCWVVLRGRDKLNRTEAIVCETWQSAIPLVMNDQAIASGTVFHAWPSIEEAKAYVSEAKLAWPPALGA